MVVNEAAASGLPLVLSDRVGAAYDLLRDGENGFLVPAGDVDATAAALKRLAADAELRRGAGARSRELVRGLGLRAFGRELRRRRARSDRAVDLFLQVGDAVPGRAPRGRDAASRQPLAQASSSESTLPDGVDDRCAVVGDDERLAVLEEPGDAAAVRDDRPACRRRPLPPRPCRSSRPPRRARTRPPAGRGRAAAPRVTGRMWTRPAVAASDCARCSERAVPCRSSGPGDDEVGIAESRRGGLEQVLDALACRDPADVEDERRVCGDAAAARASRRSRRGGRRARGSRCRARAPSRRSTPHAITRRASRSRRDDDRSSAARDAAVERRVERALEHHLAQPRLEHPERLEDVRDACEPAPRGGAGRDGIAEAEDVHDVRPVADARARRQRRRDPHPAVAQRRGEVVDGGAVDDADGGARGRAPLEVDDRRRQTSTACPCATSRRTSSPAATTGPPKAREGAQTGAAKRMRSGRSLTASRLALRGCRRAAPARSEPVLLAGRRGDGAAADRALRGAGGGHRREGRHRRPARPRGRAAASGAQRRRDRARPLDVLRALEARRRARRTTSPTSATRCCSGLRGPRPGRRALHDRPADRRRHRARSSRAATACRSS